MNMNMPKPKVGQVLYDRNVGNAARITPSVLTPVVVTAVGRKYFSCVKQGSEPRGRNETQYYLGTWHQKTDFLPSHVLYLNPEQYQNELEEMRICKRLGEMFRYGSNTRNISIGVLKQIMGLIDGESGEK